MRIFCKCGSGARKEGRKYMCLKTEQRSTTCDGIWHGNEGCMRFVRRRHSEID